MIWLSERKRDCLFFEVEDEFALHRDFLSQRGLVGAGIFFGEGWGGLLFHRLLCRGGHRFVRGGIFGGGGGAGGGRDDDLVGAGEHSVLRFERGHQEVAVVVGLAGGVVAFALGDE